MDFVQNRLVYFRLSSFMAFMPFLPDIGVEIGVCDGVIFRQSIRKGGRGIPPAA
jgi:hypothetical protein